MLIEKQLPISDPDYDSVPQITDNNSVYDDIVVPTIISVLDKPAGGNLGYKNTITMNTSKDYPIRSVLKFTTRGAKPGEPSVLWISKTGKYYRNVVDAKIDNPTRSIVYNAETGYTSFPTGTVVTNESEGSTSVVVTNPAPVVATSKKTHTVVYLILVVVVVFIVYKLIKL